MIFIHCAGNGDIYTTDTQSGVLTEFDTLENACSALAGLDDVTWFSDRDASDFYFYDFVWGDVISAVTVPVGPQMNKITFHKPERQLVRA